MVLKADISYVDDEIVKIQHSGSVDLSPYLKRDGSIAMTKNLNMNNSNINNVKAVTSGHEATNFTQLNNELSNYLHKTGGTMKGDVQMNDNHIYGVKLSIDNTSAVPRKYIDDKLETKMNISGGNFTGNISMGGNRIITYRRPSITLALVRLFQKREEKKHLNAKSFSLTVAKRLLAAILSVEVIIG